MWTVWVKNSYLGVQMKGDEKLAALKFADLPFQIQQLIASDGTMSFVSSNDENNRRDIGEIKWNRMSEGERKGFLDYLRDARNRRKFL